MRLADFATSKGLFGELRRLGYVEGQNMTVGRYSGQGRPERYGELARDVVRSAPNLIVANAARLIEHVAAATATIPIVAITNDPVAYGFAITLARPVTNITGVSVDAGLEVLGKRLEFLKEVVPAASRFAYLAPRAAWERPDAHAVREAARQAGILLIGGLLGSPIQEAEYRRVFIAMANEGVDALVVGDHAEHISNLRVIVELAESARLPAIYSYREFADGGGLMAYAIDLEHLGRRAASIIDQILQGGAKPSEIPFFQPSKIDLIINMKAAKNLGLTIPPTLLARADEVIE